MKRLTTMAQLNDPHFLTYCDIPPSTEGFKESLKKGVIKAIKTGRKKERETYIFVHGPFFVEFTCNKSFDNMRIKKQPKKVTVTEKDLNNNLYNVNVAFTGYRDSNGNHVENFFAIVKSGTPVVYSKITETGIVSKIELV